MLGLRLVREGVGFARFAALHGAALMDVFGPEVRNLCSEGLLEQDGARVRLTQRGLMLGNQVFAKFLADVDGGTLEYADVRDD